jgi:hypothetical protein
MKIDARGAAVQRKTESVLQRYETRSAPMAADADMSQFGAEGWQLVSVVPIPSDPGMVMAYFQRSRQ